MLEENPSPAHHYLLEIHLSFYLHFSQVVYNVYFYVNSLVPQAFHNSYPEGRDCVLFTFYLQHLFEGLDVTGWWGRFAQ